MPQLPSWAIPEERLDRLLALEKQRRGIAPSTLAFIGMHNVAQHWWCTQYAVLKSRAKETEFFRAYLEDRVEYACQLGLIKKPPRSDKQLLQVGAQISLAHIERFLVEQAKPDSEGLRIDQTVFPTTVDQFHDLEPFERGAFRQLLNAEKYPTLRWNFSWQKFTLIGHPDGLLSDSVYEYKSTKNSFWFKFAKPVAFAQADLYGRFFQRPSKRVQIYVEEDGRTETYEEPVSAARAE